MFIIWVTKSICVGNPVFLKIQFATKSSLKKLQNGILHFFMITKSFICFIFIKIECDVRLDK